MSVQIKIYPKALKEIDNAVIRTAELAMEALKTDVISDQVIPFDTGTMQNTDTFVDTQQDGETVISALVTGSPQARRLYYHPEYNFQTGNNHNARGEWLESWIDGDKKNFVPDTFIRILKKEACL